jgi:hypothetical protein
MSSKRKTPAQVLNTSRLVTINGRQFHARQPVLNETYLVNRLRLLQDRMISGTLEEGAAAQAELTSVWARLLEPRAADGKTVTPDWVGQLSNALELAKAFEVAKEEDTEGEAKAR